MNPSSSTPSARTGASATRSLVAILLAALVLRLPGYNESVWIDELFTADFFCGHPLVLLRTLYSDIHPPAYFVFIHYWNQVFGDREVWLRLPALLSGLASLVLVYRLGESYRDRATGLVAATLLAVSPVHIWYSQEARPYSTNILLLLVTVYAYRRRSLDPRARWTWLFAGGLLGIVFTHYYTAAYLVVFPLLAILDRDTRKRGLMIVCASVGALLAVYMGAKVHLSHVPTEKSYLRAFDPLEAWNLGFDWFLSGKSFTPRLVDDPAGAAILPVLQLLAVVVFLRGAWALFRNREGRGYHLLVHLAVLPVCLFGMYLMGLTKVYIERSALPALPFFMLVLANGLTGWRHIATRRAVAATATLATVLILTFGYMHRRDWTVYKANPDWRSAAQFLDTQITSSGEPLQLYSTDQSPSALTYYDPRIQEVKYFERNDAKIDGLLRKVDAATEGFGGFGDWIQDRLQRSIASLDEQVERKRAGVRVEVRWTYVTDPRNIPDSVGLKHFWLLESAGTRRAARAILEDRRTTLLSTHTFQDVWIHEVQLATSHDFAGRMPHPSTPAGE